MILQGEAMGSPTPTCLPPHFFRLLSSLSPATATSCDHLHLHQPALAASPAPPYFLQQWATKSSPREKDELGSNFFMSLSSSLLPAPPPSSSAWARRCTNAPTAVGSYLESLSSSPFFLSFFFFLRTLPHLSLAGFRIKLGTQARQIQVATSSWPPDPLHPRRRTCLAGWHERLATGGDKLLCELSYPFLFFLFFLFSTECY